MHAAATSAAPPSFLAFVARPCDGDCAAYAVFVSPGGRVDYCGVAHVETLGARTWQLSAAELAALRGSVTAARLETLSEDSLGGCPGAQVLMIGTEFLRLEDRCAGRSGPAALETLERQMPVLRAAAERGIEGGVGCALGAAY